MPDPPPTADQFFGIGAGAPEPGAPQGPQAPTAEDFFNPPKAPQPVSGTANDTIWGSTGTTPGKILDAIGFGSKNNWGQAAGLSPEAEATLRKIGVFNDYQKGQHDFIKSVNEAVIRPAVAAAQSTFNLLAAPSRPVQALLENNPALSETLQAFGGLAPEAHIGAPGEAPAVAAATEEAQGAGLAQARSVGVVGEGEAGFYGAEPLSPENVASRAEAAHDAGITPPTPEPPAPDIHALARRIDPDTFAEFDRLSAERDQYRRQIGDLQTQRENTPEAVRANTDLDELAGGGPAEERASRLEAVRASAPDEVIQRLDDAQGRLDKALSTDTPEMIEARNKLMETDFAMRDLSVPVSQAYRAAADIMPERPPVVEAEAEAEGAPKGTVPGETPREAAPQPVEAGEEVASTEARAETAEGAVEPAVAAGAGAEAEVAPPSVTGEQKLGNPEVEAAPKAPAGRLGGVGAVKGTGETATRSLAEGVEAKAIEDGLSSSFGDLPEYQRLSMAEQAQSVAKFMDEDYEGAKAVAMGQRQPPKGVLPESVFVGVEKRALAEGDVDTLRQLATRSKLSTAATTMGQRIRTLGERDKASPVGAIQEVQAARAADIAKRMDIEAAKTESVAEIRSEMRAARSKPDAWNDFLNAVRCDS